MTDREELLSGVGHLCFDCRRKIEAGETITLTHMGPLPIYYHAVCRYGESKGQDLYEATKEGEVYYE